MRSSKTADNLLSLEFPLVRLWKIINPGAFKSRYPEFLKGNHAQ